MSQICSHVFWLYHTIRAKFGLRIFQCCASKSNKKTHNTQRADNAEFSYLARILLFVKVVFIAGIRMTALVSRFYRCLATLKATGGFHGDQYDRTKTLTNNHKKGITYPSCRWSADGRKYCTLRKGRQPRARHRSISFPAVYSCRPS